MNYERKPSNQVDHRAKVWADFRQYCHQWGRVFRAWLRLAGSLLRCLALTLTVLLKTVLWMLRMLNPLPSTTSHYQRWQRRRETGLRIPALDISLLMFGALCLVGYTLQTP